MNMVLLQAGIAAFVAVLITVSQAAQLFGPSFRAALYFPIIFPAVGAVTFLFLAVRAARRRDTSN